MLGYLVSHGDQAPNLHTTFRVYVLFLTTYLCVTSRSAKESKDYCVGSGTLFGVTGHTSYCGSDPMFKVDEKKSRR